MPLHTSASPLSSEKTHKKQKLRNVYPLGVVNFKPIQYDAYVITLLESIDTEEIFIRLREVEPKVIRSIRSSMWYEYFEGDPGLLLIEWGNRGLTTFFYNTCYYGPSLEIVARSYYYRWADETWKVETSTDPFVSVYGIRLLSNFINDVQNRSVDNVLHA